MQRDDAFEFFGQVRAPGRLALGIGVLSRLWVCGRWSTAGSRAPEKVLRLGEMPPTEMPPKPTP